MPSHRSCQRRRARTHACTLNSRLRTDASILLSTPGLAIKCIVWEFFESCQECLGIFAMICKHTNSGSLPVPRRPASPVKEQTAVLCTFWGFRVVWRGWLWICLHTLSCGEAAIVPPGRNFSVTDIPINVGRSRAADARAGFLTTTCRRHFNRFRGCTSCNKESASRRSVDYHTNVEIGIA